MAWTRQNSIFRFASVSKDSKLWVNGLRFHPTVAYLILLVSLPSLKIPKTNISPENRPKPKRKVVLQLSIFSGKLLVLQSSDSKDDFFEFMMNHPPIFHPRNWTKSWEPDISSHHFFWGGEKSSKLKPSTFTTDCVQNVRVSGVY